MSRAPVLVTAEAADFARARAAWMRDPTGANSAAVAALEAWEATGYRVDPDPLSPTGEMPEPWPGMGVEHVIGGTVHRYVAWPTLVDGVWRMLPAGLRCTADEAKRYLPLSDVTAIYDGRVCIWRRP